MSEPRDRRQPPDFGIPDLVVPPPRPSQSGLHAVTPGEPSAASSALRAASRAASELELESDEWGGPKLELQLELPISGSEILAHYERGAAFSSDDLAAATPGIRAAVTNPVALGAVWPDGKTPDRARVLLDPNDVQRCAAYGAAPKGMLTTPVYAARVWLRRRALVASLRAANEELADAESQRDALLTRMLEQLRPELDKQAGFSQRPSLANATPLEMARAILAARGEIEVDAQTLEVLSAADERVRASLKESELHLRALDACDRSKLEQGTTLLALAGATAVAAILRVLL